MTDLFFTHSNRLKLYEEQIKEDGVDIGGFAVIKEAEDFRREEDATAEHIDAGAINKDGGEDEEVASHAIEGNAAYGELEDVEIEENVAIQRIEGVGGKGGALDVHIFRNKMFD